MRGTIAPMQKQPAALTLAILAISLVLGACSGHDDPFHPPGVLHDVARIASRNPALQLEFTARGGHVGFVEGTRPGRVDYYAERRIAEFGKARLSAPASEGVGALEAS